MDDENIPSLLRNFVSLGVTTKYESTSIIFDKEACAVDDYLKDRFAVNDKLRFIVYLTEDVRNQKYYNILLCIRIYCIYIKS